MLKAHRPASEQVLSVMLSAAVIVCLSAPVCSETLLAKSILYRSQGQQLSDGTVVLTQNGYLGTYVQLTSPGPVTFTISASGQSAGGVAPQMHLHVADSKASWSVSGGTFSNYTTTFNLPAGTFSPRLEFTNQGTVGGVTRSLSIASMGLSGSSASFVNNDSDDNALAAADNYILNYRRGPATVTILDAMGNPVPAGVSVRAKMKRLAFNLGTCVPGSYADLWWADPNPAPGSDTDKYQKFVDSHFNTITPEACGKWAYQESTRNVVVMTYIDQYLDYAEQHGLRARMHPLLWDNEMSEPAWVNDLEVRAAAGDTAAAADLRAAITSRIAYYITPRAGRYYDFDCINETVANPIFTTIYGFSGIAGIYNEAVAASNGRARACVNELTVDQDANYGEFYRSNIQSIMDAGGTVQAIGRQGNLQSVNRTAARVIHRNLQNMDVFELPISTTEYRVGMGSDTAIVLNNMLRLMFGNDLTTTFLMWGFWRNAIYNPGLEVLANADWTLTACGVEYERLMALWSTDDTEQTDANGRVQFTGYYGDYDVTINGVTYPLKLVKGTTTYQIAQPSIIISNVQVTNITVSSATISWSTDKPATTQVYYGTSPSYGQTTTKDAALTTSHSVNLTGLTGNTVYHFCAESIGNTGIVGRSGDRTFMTLTAPLEVIVDNLQGNSIGTWTALTDSGGWPTTASQYVYASNRKSSTTATFVWTPTIPVPGHYNVYCWYKAGADRTTSARYTIGYSGGQMMVVVVNETAHGSQWYKIADSVQFDAGAGGYVQLTNKTGENDGTKKVVADAIRFEYAENDTTPPSAPTGLAATAASTSQINLTWSASTDNQIVMGYRVYRNSQIVGITSSTSYSDTGLDANTQCTYTVTAYDAKYNESAASTPVARYTFARTVTAPNVTCDKSTATSYSSAPFTFTNDGFGPGKLSYYRYVWDNSVGHTWADTEAGWTTASMVLNATSASPYWYLHVKGYNGDGVGCGTLGCGPYRYGTPFARIADAMNNPNGAQVLIIQYKPITGVFGTYFYIEESDRTRGIRVDAATARSVGDAVSVAGRLTSSDGERRLSDAAVLDWTPGTALLPLLTRVTMLGGTAPDSYTAGMPGASGLYNIGLLVRVAGAVVSHTAGSFVLEDGSGATVKAYSGADVSDGSLVGVTGVCSVENGARVIRTRSAGDVRVYAQ